MTLGGITKPLTNFAEKAAKAQKVKSVKMKIKFGDGKNQRVSGVQAGKPAQDQRD